MSYPLIRTAQTLPLKPVITLVGPEAYVRRRVREILTARALEGAMVDLNFSRYQAGEDDIPKALGECLDLPCFAPWRVISISEIGKLKKQVSQALIDYLDKASPSTMLILEDDKLDQRLDWVKQLKKKSHYIDIPPASEQDCYKFVASLFKKEGKEVSHELCRTLVGWTGNSLEALSTRVLQLSTYVGERQEVFVEDLNRALMKVSEENIFDLIDAVFVGNLENLHSLLDGLLAQGEEPLKILALLNRHLSILLSMQHSHGPDFFKLSPYIQNKYEQQVRKYGNKLSLSLLKPIATCDRELKGSGKPGDLVLKNCIEKIRSLLC